MGYGQGTLGILARYLHAEFESPVVHHIYQPKRPSDPMVRLHIAG